MHIPLFGNFLLAVETKQGHECTPACDCSCGGVQDVPSAHTGFLNRARGVPIESLYRHATRLNKRLVLTGTLFWSSMYSVYPCHCTLDSPLTLTHLCL